MIAKTSHTWNIPGILCNYIVPLILIIVFSYTAVAKSYEHKLFVYQVAKNPYLKGFSTFISYFIPLAELAAASFLLFKNTRVLGLWLSFILMAAFTVYILYMLAANQTACSCGGIVAAMSWTQHLYFNIALTLLTVISILYHNSLHVYKGSKLKTF